MKNLLTTYPVRGFNRQVDAWYYHSIQHLLIRGEHRQGRNGATYSLFGQGVDFDCRKEFPILTCKKMNMQASVGETLAFLQGADDAETFRAFGCSFWDDNAKSEYWLANPNRSAVVKHPEGLGRIYGVQWRTWKGVGADGNSVVVDQMQELLKGLRSDPYGRRHIVTAWNPAELPMMALPPCHSFFQVYCHTDGGISLQMYQRSADLFLGVPYNITSYALLLNILAVMTGRTPRYLSMRFGDFHLYEVHETEDKALSKLKRQYHENAESQGIPDPMLLGITTDLTAESDFSPESMAKWAKPENFKLSHYQHQPFIKARMIA